MFLKPPIMLVTFLSLLFMAATAEASWNGTRDRAMTMREQGNAAQAYSLVASYKASGADKFDRDFVAGWLALRHMARRDLAFEHFKSLAMSSANLRPHVRDAGRAKAGYWLGRTLNEMGRAADAKAMFSASMVYANTFYGQLSASELKSPVNFTAVSRYADQYPVRQVYWHDSRVRIEFVHAVIKEESNFKQNANSSADARGMMQVLDGTARHVGKTAGVPVDVGLMRSNADYNIAVGSKYLADQLERYQGNTMLAAAAYNAGPARADEWLKRFGDPRGGRVDPVDWVESIPFKETREYVQKVMGSYITYLALGTRN